MAVADHFSADKLDHQAAPRFGERLLNAPLQAPSPHSTPGSASRLTATPPVAVLLVEPIGGFDRLVKQSFRACQI
jgi:hypothetical protein